jgi:hypothetical protein
VQYLHAPACCRAHLAEYRRGRSRRQRCPKGTVRQRSVTVDAAFVGPGVRARVVATVVAAGEQLVAERCSGVVAGPARSVPAGRPGVLGWSEASLGAGEAPPVMDRVKESRVASTADEAFSLLPSCVTPRRPRDGLVSISWCGARRLSNTTAVVGHTRRRGGAFVQRQRAHPHVYRYGPSAARHHVTRVWLRADRKTHQECLMLHATSRITISTWTRSSESPRLSPHDVRARYKMQCPSVDSARMPGPACTVRVDFSHFVRVALHHAQSEESSRFSKVRCNGHIYNWVDARGM